MTALQTWKPQDPPALPAGTRPRCPPGWGSPRQRNRVGTIHISGHPDHCQHCMGLCQQADRGLPCAAYTSYTISPSQPQALPSTAPARGGSHLAGSQQPHQLLRDSIPVLLHKPITLVFHLAEDKPSTSISPQLPRSLWCGALLGHSSRLLEEGLAGSELLVATLPSSHPAARLLVGTITARVSIFLLSVRVAAQH